jgi:transglutaminase-like putative cysteine protease
MRLRIRHETAYHYDRPVDLAAAVVRLTPPDHAGQRVLAWRVVDGSGRPLARFSDGYGNVCHLATVNSRHQDSAIVAEGEVDTGDSVGVLEDMRETLPPLYFLRQTAATQPDAAIQDLARAEAASADPVERLHRLMAAIRARIVYEVGATSVATSAAEALAHGRGVCQDHAHVMIAAARLLGHPARYVSGYLWDGSSAPGVASHAWAEARIESLGWVGFDAANGVSPTPAYVRVAIGLDYTEAAPVRGIRRGLAEETLAVAVEVQQVHPQQ